jgi:hypothetical protein
VAEREPTRVVNQQETIAAREAQQKLKDRFSDQPWAAPSAPPDFPRRPCPQAASQHVALQSGMVSFLGKRKLLLAYQGCERRVATFYDLPGIPRRKECCGIFSFT